MRRFYWLVAAGILGCSKEAAGPLPPPPLPLGVSGLWQGGAYFQEQLAINFELRLRDSTGGPITGWGAVGLSGCEVKGAVSWCYPPGNNWFSVIINGRHGGDSIQLVLSSTSTSDECGDPLTVRIIGRVLDHDSTMNVWAHRAPCWNVDSDSALILRRG